MENKKRLTDVNPIIRNLTAMKSVYDAIALDGMIKALEEAPTVDAAELLREQWISVDDKLPETEEEVLVLTVSKTGNVNVDKGYLLNGRFVHRGSAVVTHWMPLPEPPEVDKP